MSWNNIGIEEWFEEINRVLRESGDKAEKISAYRREASRLASLANKRAQRLEKADLKDTPAYKKYIENGGKFGVKGKTFNEVQQEVSRLKKFILSGTSTIRGANKVLKEIASNTGISYKNLNELRTKSKKFFELSSKVEQYLRNVDDMASAIGYQKIWETINEYVDKGEIDLNDEDSKIDGMIELITDAIKEYDKPIATVGRTGWFTLK